MRSLLAFVVVLATVGAGVFLVGWWLTSVTVRPTPLLVTTVRSVSYLTPATQERQFLIDVPLADAKHFTELMTTKTEARIDLPAIRIAVQPDKTTKLTLPAATLGEPSWDGATIVRNASHSPVIDGYERFARRWSARYDQERLLKDAADNATAEFQSFYGSAGAKVEIDEANSPAAKPPALVSIDGSLGDFRLDRDYAAQVASCPDEPGDCFNLRIASSSIRVRVFDTESLRQMDTKLSQVFDQSHPDHVIEGAYLFDNTLAFFRPDGGHLYAFYVDAANPSDLGDVLPIALEMVLSFTANPLDGCTSAGGVDLDRWRRLTTSGKRAVWAMEVATFGDIWSRVPVETPGGADTAAPIDGTVTGLFWPEASDASSSATPFWVAVDQAGFNARQNDQDSFDKTFAAEYAEATGGNQYLTPDDVMLAILDWGRYHRDRMMLFDEQNVLEFVPYRDWIEPQVARNVSIADFSPHWDGEQAKFTDRTGVGAMDYVLGDISLRSADLGKLLKWLSTDHSPLTLERCAVRQAATQGN